MRPVPILSPLPQSRWGPTRPDGKDTPGLPSPARLRRIRLGGDYSRLRHDLGVFFGRIAKGYERTE